MEQTTLLIKLTHSQTGRPTNIMVKDITCVRENTEGKTLILTGSSGQYVTETVEQVLTTLGSVGYEVI